VTTLSKKLWVSFAKEPYKRDDILTIRRHDQVQATTCRPTSRQVETWSTAIWPSATSSSATWSNTNDDFACHNLPVDLDMIKWRLCRKNYGSLLQKRPIKETIFLISTWSSDDFVWQADRNTPPPGGFPFLVCPYQRAWTRRPPLKKRNTIFLKNWLFLPPFKLKHAKKQNLLGERGGSAIKVADEMAMWLCDHARKVAEEIWSNCRKTLFSHFLLVKYSCVCVCVQHEQVGIAHKSPATHCNTLQHTATRCNTLQHAATATHSAMPTSRRRNSIEISQNVNFHSLLINIVVGCDFWAQKIVEIDFWVHWLLRTEDCKNWGLKPSSSVSTIFCAQKSVHNYIY